MTEINEVWKYIATTSLGIIISMVGFWFTVARHMITKAEVVEMLETKSPYLQDKHFIMERLAVNKENQAQFALALQRNTEVMNELKIQLATLGKTLEALEERIERHGNI
jgi:predicted RND superfamily exporter protein